MRMHNLNLLLVEDDEVDRMAVRRALRELAIDAAVVEAHDGQQALDIIAGSADVASFATADGYQHVITLGSNGRLTETWWQPGKPIGHSDLGTTAGTVAVSAFAN